MSDNLKRTPLYDAHIRSKARMVDFAGWEMPVMYTGILEEARAVRTSVGLFDISHMGRTRITGSGATGLLQRITSNNAAGLHYSQAQYSLLTNPDGGIIDDIIVYREAADSYLVVINAGNRDKDLAWIRSHMPTDAELIDNSDLTAMIAVQGPMAPGLVATVAGDQSLLEIGRFHYAAGQVSGIPATFCRTGYTGEDGFELIVPSTAADTVWEALVQGGGVPCGLGARDALRIEAGYPLYGHEIDDTTTPVEALLMWAVSMDKGDFTGRDVIAEVKAAGPKRKLMGLTSPERIQPRQGYTVFVGSEPIGQITSGVFSPTLGHSVAMGYIDSAYARAGAGVEIGIRDKRAGAVLKPKKDLLKV